MAKDIEAKPNDPEYNKLISQNTLTMLNDIECVLNAHLELFGEFEKEDSKTYNEVQKDIRAYERKRNREENLDREREL